jgi:hypothetical protein
VAPAATATTTVTGTGSDVEVEVIGMGVALFSGTGIFRDGAIEWERIRRAGRDEAKNVGGSTELG